MPFFVVTYAYTPDSAARDEVRPTHRAWLASLGDILVVSGPTDADGAFLVFEGADAAEVGAVVDADPFVTDGRVVGSRTVVGWTPVLGRAKDRL
ncbi:YciI family protein [Kineococcus radiotolerans]|uniref:YCII-related n=1 Tax=Kineococcus radiotolerans (strain ATCC BAA-149 / DSM 14245 / SRS30216) TaxID=266940 RepID=A6WFL6_KINRD|nr:YciI family protein [Kineococcus radiotolerans]ABS05605.1 YCII-related [Kineococcus radiotolerans SRS30216 = ATCC BAA-149]